MGGACGKSGRPRFDPHNHSFQYDMIVIGGGSGGIACAREAARLGANVALCDFVTPTPTGTTWGLGGTCVNVGCIPKRLMHQSSLIKDFIGDASLFGWKVPEAENVDWGALVESVQDYIKSLNFSYKISLSTEKVTLYKALARFKSEHEIVLISPDKEDEVITGQCIVIAVGCRPKYLDIPGGTEKDKLCITSDDLFSLPYPPGKTVCIGAGYISTECAGFLAGFGFDVTLFARSVLLREFDKEFGDLITSNLVGRTVGILTNTETKEITKVKDGSPPTLSIKYTLKSVQTTFDMECNTVLLAIGRKPCTKDLKLDVVKVKADDEGYIITDKFECTNLPHIFAIGDCAKDRPQLTPSAIKAGQYLARRIYDKKFSKVVDYPNIPTSVFTPIEYGSCGLTEEAAITKFGKKNVESYMKNKGPLEFVMNKRDSESTTAKLVCLKAGKGREKVVGFHCLGPNAAEITVGFSMAVKNQSFKDQFDDLVGIHPTNAEIFTELRDKKSDGKAKNPDNC